MAQETIGAKLEVEYGSVGELRKAIKEATGDLIAMQQQFGETSQEAIDAAKRVAGLKDRLQEAKEVTDLFDPGAKFKAFGNAVNAVAGGFSALQGAMGIFGVESKEVEKQLLRVQSAMALSQGLSTILDSGKDFQRLASIIGTQLAGAFKSLRAAIVSTGIGALVVALGLIVAYWEDIKSLVSGVSAEQKKAAETAAQNTKAAQDQLEAITGSEQKLRAQGKTEKEILQIKMQANKLIIESAQKEIQIAEQRKKVEVAAAKRNQQFLQNALRFSAEVGTAFLRVFSAPLDLLIITANKVSKLLGMGEISSFTINEQISKMNETVTNWASIQIFNPEETAKQGDAEIEAMKKTIAKAENEYYGHQNRLTEMAKQAAQKRDAADKAEAEARKKRRQEIEKEEETRQGNIDKILEGYIQKREEREAKSEAQKLELQRKRDIQQLTQLGATQMQIATANKYWNDLIAQEQQNATIAASQSHLQRLQEQSKAATAIRQKEYEDSLAIIQARIAAENELLSSISGAIGALGQMFDQGTAASKAAALAEIAINTGIGFANGLRIAQEGAKATGPAAPFAFPIFYASQIAAVLKAVGQAKRILSTVKGGAAAAAGNLAIGSTAAPVAPQVSPQAQLQIQNQQAINNLGNQAVRAYVLNSDIRNNEQRNAYLQRNARIG